MTMCASIHLIYKIIVRSNPSHMLCPVSMQTSRGFQDPHHISFVRRLLCLPLGQELVDSFVSICAIEYLVRLRGAHQITIEVLLNSEGAHENVNTHTNGQVQLTDRRL